MSRWRLILSSLWFHRRLNLALVLGVAVGTAVITGALLIGDSVRGTLRDLTLERLGWIDQALVTPRFFRAALAAELAAQPEFSQRFSGIAPAILVEANVQSPTSLRRAGHVTLVGADESFWNLDQRSRMQPELGANAIVINRELAAELQVDVGDEVIVRVGRPSEIPADSPLGRKTETVRTVRLEIADVINLEGLGRFSLFPSQRAPRNAYVATSVLQKLLEQPSRVNALFIRGKEFDVAGSTQDEQWLAHTLQPNLIDLGLRLIDAPEGFWQLEAEQMLIDNAVASAVQQHTAARRLQPSLTYLANEIAIGDRTIPYSTITAVDLAVEPPLGPFVDPAGTVIQPLAEDEVLLNTWAAEQLGIPLDFQFDPSAPTLVRVTYFEPESTHGEILERSSQFRLRGIVRMEGLAADARWTPELAGVTDQESIADWNPPFPFDAARVRPVDDDYWEDYRATPKAFVSLSTGERLWGNRFGKWTGARWIRQSTDPAAEELVHAWQLDPAKLGFAFQPIKRLGLEAAAGTTPFAGLFLGFSLFLIAAALMLIGLLVALGLDQRSNQVGLLKSLGLTARWIRTTFWLEGCALALLGSLLGLMAGVAYAELMLWGLRTQWVAAVSAPVLRMHLQPASLLIGGVAGVLVSALVIWWGLRRLERQSVRSLLVGGDESLETERTAGQRSGMLALASVVLAAALLPLGWMLEGEARAGTFFGSGALGLTAGMFGLWYWLTHPTSRSLLGSAAPLTQFAWRNAARNATRTTLTVGLVAAATFVIVSMGLFRLEPPPDLSQRGAGSGGFLGMAESDLPLYYDLGSPTGRTELGFSAAENQELNDVAIIPLRMRPGEDASCLNLYQTRSPRIVGVTPRLIERGGFAWSGSIADSSDPAEFDNPWMLLQRELEPSTEGIPQVPMVLDQNTATYSLHLSGLGATLDIRDEADRPLRMVVVGLLKNSTLQGDVLMSDAQFLKHFPQSGGYRMFLIDAPPTQIDRVATLLEGALEGYGLDVELSGDRLEQFFAVQNTYLATFQSIGGLGLLLGILGVAVVMLRNVWQRRGELALLRAAGFRRTRLAALVLIENTLLIVSGLALGLVAAAWSVAPYLAAQGTNVPWASLAVTLGSVFVVGMLSGLLAVRATITAPLLPALRGQ
jgi:ABC-type lipoprotein release transport system permease subunit